MLLSTFFYLLYICTRLSLCAHNSFGSTCTRKWPYSNIQIPCTASATILNHSLYNYSTGVGENHNQRSAKPATIIIISNLCINKIRMECNSHFDTIID
jgi:hypothetical protein